MRISAVALIISAVYAVHAQYYVVPDVRVEPLKPKGLRMSIPDEIGVGLFAIHVNVNKPIFNREGGQINLETKTTKHGRFTIVDPRARLKVGDVLHYWVYVEADGIGYPKDDLTYNVTELVQDELYPVSSNSSDARCQYGDQFSNRHPVLQNAETTETRELCTKELERLILLEQLKLIRVQTQYYQMKVKDSSALFFDKNS